MPRLLVNNKSLSLKQYLLQWDRKIGSYDILIDISEHVTIFKLMGSLGNVNHDIIVVGYWIFDSNYEKLLVLNR